MKIRTFSILMISVIFFTSASVLKKTDFTGSWVFNLDKSNLGGLPSDKAAPAFVNIIQKPASLKLERTFGQNSPTVEYYDFDSKPIDTTMGIYKKSSFMKWTADEKGFIISSHYEVSEEGKAPWEYTRTETYSLFEDGKTLTIDRVSVLPDRTETIKAVYNRQ